jgi:hypothetical protein
MDSIHDAHFRRNINDVIFAQSLMCLFVAQNARYICLIYFTKSFHRNWHSFLIRGCIQKFPDRSPGAKATNSTTLGHYMQLHIYIVSESSEFFRYNPLCCFSTTVHCSKRVYLYRLSPGTFGYTLVCCEKNQQIFKINISAFVYCM